MKNLVLLELFPIVLVVELWGEAFRNHKVRFNCDNMGVVMAINNILASSLPVVRLLRHFVLLCLSLNAFIYAVHIPGVTNKIANALSRSQFKDFRVLVPEAEQHGTPCPAWLWMILMESLLD